MTPNPVWALTVRKPDRLLLQAYLLNHSPHGVDLFQEGVVDGLVWGLTPKAEILYQDISGDGQADLIVSDRLYAAAMVWQTDHYSLPVHKQFYPWHYHPASHVSFEDWTADGTPEVIFDVRGDTGGTGFIDEGWERYVIHCTAKGCAFVLEFSPGTLSRDSNSNGMQIGAVRVSHSKNATGQPLVTIYTDEFTVSCWFCFPPTPSPGTPPPGRLGYYVYPSSEDIYVWDGDTFRQQSHTIQTNPASRPTPNLEATNAQGTRASITHQVKPTSPVGAIDTCTLHVNDTTVFDSFDCLADTTTVEWKDVTGDGIAELVIETAVDTTCFGQRMLIFRWDGHSAAPVADISGCSVRADFFGVRLADLNRDGILEIVSAGKWVTDECDPYKTDDLNCWYALNQHDSVYKWDGKQFVFWKTIPRE